MAGPSPHVNAPPHDVNAHPHRAAPGAGATPYHQGAGGGGRPKAHPKSRSIPQDPKGSAG